MKNTSQQYLNSEAHGYLMEAKACKLLLKDLERIRAKLKRHIEKEAADREAEFDVQTVSGWVMELFECIPKAGDFHTDEEFKLEIEVTEMSGKRIEQVRIRDLREPEEEEKE